MNNGWFLEIGYKNDYDNEEDKEIKRMLADLYREVRQNDYIADNGIKNPFSTLKGITNVYDMEYFISCFARDVALMQYITEPFIQEVENPTNRREPFERRRNRRWSTTSTNLQ